MMASGYVHCTHHTYNDDCNSERILWLCDKVDTYLLTITQMLDICNQLGRLSNNTGIGKCTKTATTATKDSCNVKITATNIKRTVKF